jgi:hypothetical protein
VRRWEEQKVRWWEEQKVGRWEGGKSRRQGNRIIQDREGKAAFWIKKEISGTFVIWRFTGGLFKLQ